MTSLKSGKKYYEENVSSVVEKDLCIGCGACKGVCPNEKTIYFEERNGLNTPIIDESKCVHCGLCYKVCPGENINFDELSDITFHKFAKRDKFIGNIESVWIGYSNNTELRKNASSGGLTTAILSHALKTNIIDSAVVVKFDPNNPVRPKVVFTDNIEDIIQSRGSKYCPVPMAEAIRYIKSSNKKVAFVGLPCHIQAVKTASKYYKKLKENIVIYLGLFCQWAPTFDGLDFFFRLKNINTNNVERFEYRGNGWPGGMTIEEKSKERKIIPLQNYWGVISKFALNRCLVCPELLNEFADISLGDAWGYGYPDDQFGTSIIVIRTSSGKKLWDSLRKSGDITFAEVNEEILKKTQIRSLEFKKLNHNSKVHTFKLLKIPHPEFKGIYSSRIINIEILRIIIFLINRKIFKSKKLWPGLIIYINIRNNLVKLKHLLHRLFPS